MANIMTRPAVGPATVTLHDSMLENGTVVKRAKVTFVGDTAKLYQWQEGTDKRGPHFREIDKLTDCTFEESDDGAHITVVGDSEQILEEMGEVMRNDRRARWEIDIHGCDEC